MTSNYVAIMANIIKPGPDDTVIPDHIEAYYKTLQNGEDPDPDMLIVVKESHALQAIAAVINSVSTVECILDSSCQIISMSKETCNELELTYNP